MELLRAQRSPDLEQIPRMGSKAVSNVTVADRLHDAERLCGTTLDHQWGAHTMKHSVLVVLALAFTCTAQRNDLITIPQGTPVVVRLMTALSSAQSHTNDLVSMEVVDDVTVNGAVVISRTAVVMGRVTTAKTARRMGRSGKLAIDLQTVRASDGSLIPVVAARVANGKNGYGAGSGVCMAATVVLFWPATPLWLLKHGHDTEIPYGTVFTIQVARDSPVDLANALPALTPFTQRLPLPVRQHNKDDVEGPVRGETISGPGSDGSATSSQESLGDLARREKAKKAARQPE